MGTAIAVGPLRRHPTTTVKTSRLVTACGRLTACDRLPAGVCEHPSIRTSPNGDLKLAEAGTPQEVDLKQPHLAPKRSGTACRGLGPVRTQRRQPPAKAVRRAFAPLGVAHLIYCSEDDWTWRTAVRPVRSRIDSGRVGGSSPRHGEPICGGTLCRPRPAPPGWPARGRMWDLDPRRGIAPWARLPRY